MISGFDPEFMGMKKCNTRYLLERAKHCGKESKTKSMREELCLAGRKKVPRKRVGSQ